MQLTQWIASLGALVVEGEGVITNEGLKILLDEWADGKSLQFRSPCGDMVWWSGQSGGVCPTCHRTYTVENMRLEAT